MLALDPSGTSRVIVGIAARDSSNTLQTIDAGYARDSASTRRTVFASLAVTSSPDPLIANGYSGGLTSPWTPFTTATATGGTPPYTYAWSVDNSWNVLNPASASTAFQSTALAPGDSSFATGTVIATDANGLTATGYVSCSAYNNHF